MGLLLTFLGATLIVLGVLGAVLAVFTPAGSRYRLAEGPAGIVGPVLLIIVGIGLLLVPVA